MVVFPILVVASEHGPAQVPTPTAPAATARSRSTPRQIELMPCQGTASLSDQLWRESTFLVAGLYARLEHHVRWTCRLSPPRRPVSAPSATRRRWAKGWPSRRIRSCDSVPTDAPAFISRL